MTAGGAPLRRYPGAAPFSDSPLHRKLFFGRSKDAKNLVDTILADALVVLYAKSGTGKTSLVNVEVKERLREQGYAPLVVRVDKRDLGPLKTVFDGIRQAASDQGFEHQPGSQASLWHYFKTTELWREDLLLKPVLIIDQFEELFTLHGADAREAMITQLAHLLRGPAPPLSAEAMTPELAGLTETMPAVKVVLSMREDFLANLDELSRALPNILTTRYRLGPLGREQARQAIDEPATVADDSLETPQFAFESGVVEKVLGFLASRSSSIDGGEIEPFQIQVVCQHVEELVRARAAKAPGQKIAISFSDLGGEEGLRKTILEFYERQLNALPRRLRRRVERLCEQGLASREGRRLSQEQDEIQRRFKIDETLLGLLVQSRLLRSEPRLGGHHYELSHDTLLFPVLRARDSHVRRRRLQFAGATLLVALVPMIYIAIDQYHKHYLRKQAELLQQYDQAPESDSEGRLILALGAVGAGLRAGAPDPRAVEILAMADQHEATTVTTLPAEVSVAVLSPSAHSVATATKTGRVELRDPAGKSWRVLEPGPWADVTHLAFSADATRIAAAAGATIRVWDITGRKISDLAIPSPATGKLSVTALAIDPVSDAVFVATAGGGWTRLGGPSVVTGEVPKQQTQPPTLVRLAVSSDGKALYGVSTQGVTYGWAATGQYRLELPVDAGLYVWASAPNGSRVAAIVGDRVRLFQKGRVRDIPVTEARSESAPSRKSAISNTPTSLAFSPDSDSLAVGMLDGGALIFALTDADAKIRQRLSSDSYSSAEAIAWSRDGKKIAVLQSEIDYASRYDYMYRDASGRRATHYLGHFTLFTLSTSGSPADQTPSDQAVRRSDSASRLGGATPRPSDSKDRTSFGFSIDRAIDSFWLADDSTAFIRDEDGKIKRIVPEKPATDVAPRSAAMVPVACEASTSFLIQTTSASAPALLTLSTGTAAPAPWRWAPNAFGQEPQELQAVLCATSAPFYAVTIGSGRPHLWKSAAGGGQFAEVPIEGGSWSYPAVTKAFARGGRFLLIGGTGLIQTLSPDGTVASFAGEERPILPHLLVARDGSVVSWAFAGQPVRGLASDSPIAGKETATGSELTRTVALSWDDHHGIMAATSVDSSERVVAVDDHGDIHLMYNLGLEIDAREVWKTALQNVEQVAATADGFESLALSRSAAGVYAVAHIQARPQTLNTNSGDRIAVGAHGQLVTTLTSDPKAWGVWDPKFEDALILFSRLTGPCTPSAIAASPVSDEVILGCEEGMIKKRTGSGTSLPDPADAFDVSRMDCGPDATRPDDATKSKIVAVAYAPSGRFFVGATSSRLAVWSADGALVAKAEQLEEAITAVALGAGDVVAASSSSGKILLWKLTGNNLTALPALGGFGAMADDVPTSVEFSPDGRRLLAGFEGGAIRLFDWSVRSTVKEITMHSRRTKENINIVNVTFFADGHRFAAGSSEGEFQVWSDLGEPQTPLIGVGRSLGEPVAVATLPNGQVVTSAAIRLDENPAVSLDDWISHACDRLRHSNRFGTSADDASAMARDACARHAAGGTGDRNASLLTAAAAGHTSDVESALAAGVNPNAADAAGRTPLMQALGKGHLQTALVLLSHGADVRRVDETKQTALHYAARGDVWRIVPQLLAAGLAVDQPDMNGRSALMVAAHYGSRRVVQALLTARASVNATDEFGRTALMYAAEANQSPVLKELVDAHADVDVRDRLSLSFGRTALQIAGFAGATEAMERLKAGASPEVVAVGDNSFFRFPVEFLAAAPARRESVAGLAAWTAGTLNTDGAAALLRTLESRAASGEARDILLLGMARAIGLAGKPDWKEARDRFKLADERGDLLGRSLHGLLVANGLGGRQDVSAGRALVQKALDGAEPFAAWYLANFASIGTEAEQNATAQAMLRPAQEKGYGPLWNQMALLEIGRDDFNEARTTSRCEAAVKQDVERAVALGDPMAIRNWTERQWLTRGPDLSFDRAVERMIDLRKGLVMLSNPVGRPEARVAFLAGVAYEHGAGVPQDHAAAMKWLTKASEWGDATASRELGRIYELGFGEPVSVPTALRYYRLSAAAGDSYSRVRLRSLDYGF